MIGGTISRTIPKLIYNNYSLWIKYNTSITKSTDEISHSHCHSLVDKVGEGRHVASATILLQGLAVFKEDQRWVTVDFVSAAQTLVLIAVNLCRDFQYTNEREKDIHFFFIRT